MHTRSKLECIKKIQKRVRIHLLKRKIVPYKYIKFYYNKYLKKYGCKLPSENSQIGKALEFLYINIKKNISIDDIRNYVFTKIKNNNVCDSLQIRHLGLQYGFNLLKGNDIIINSESKVPKSHYCLYNLKNIYINYHKNRRKDEINKNNWFNLKKDYNFCCATCGNKENKPLRYNKNRLTILQKGHMDPRKSMTLDNIIPQCQYCNQNYKNKAIFNKRGIVINFNPKGF
jgi:hypothetical protein